MLPWQWQCRVKQNLPLTDMMMFFSRNNDDDFFMMMNIFMMTIKIFIEFFVMMIYFRRLPLSGRINYEDEDL